MGEEVSVTIIATGFEQRQEVTQVAPQPVQVAPQEVKSDVHVRATTLDRTENTPQQAQNSNAGARKIETPIHAQPKETCVIVEEKTSCLLLEENDLDVPTFMRKEHTMNSQDQ